MIIINNRSGSPEPRLNLGTSSLYRVAAAWRGGRVVSVSSRSRISTMTSVIESKARLEADVEEGWSDP